jgi:gamma-glutamyltranspeptidase/glutathione hydrolase
LTRTFLPTLVAILVLRPSPLPAQAEAVSSTRGMVVSTSDIASDIGAAILSKGGNAIDAAVATGFALAVTHPSAGNIGGGGFMVIRFADGKATTIDYREKAPLRSTRTMYLGEDGEIDRSLTASGWLAPGVPGTVRGLRWPIASTENFPGRMSWIPPPHWRRRGFPCRRRLREA